MQDYNSQYTCHKAPFKQKKKNKVLTIRYAVCNVESKSHPVLNVWVYTMLFLCYQIYSMPRCSSFGLFGAEFLPRDPLSPTSHPSNPSPNSRYTVPVEGRTLMIHIALPPRNSTSRNQHNSQPSSSKRCPACPASKKQVNK